MMVGLFEPVAAPWRVEGVPSDFSFGKIPPDWDRMGPFLEKAMARVPVTLDAGVRTFFCGPESFTPDLAPAVGEAPGLRNYFVAAGMNSVGILSAGGLGPGAGALDHHRSPRCGRHRLQRGPVPPVAGRRHLPRRPDHRDPRHRVRRAHAGQAAAHGARHPAVAGARPAGRAGRLPARGVRLGGRGLVRRSRRHADRRAHLGQGPVVRSVGGRAPRRPRGRRPDGHELHGEVHRAGRRRRRRTRAGLGRRRDRLGGDHHLHAVARRRRPDRGRPDRHQARRRRLLRGRLGHRARPHPRLAGQAHRRGRRPGHRRDRPTTPSSTCRARARGISLPS